jgi:Protein of unknown function (DUF2795)
MERSSKHGPHVDEAMKHDVEGAVRAGRSTRAEEWKDPEPFVEDQPDPDRAPETTLTGGTPPGMTPEDVELRARIASYLGKDVYPAERDELVVRMTERQAPDRLRDMVAGLPAGRRFDNMNEVAEALGLGVESRRF